MSALSGPENVYCDRTKSPEFVRYACANPLDWRPGLRPLWAESGLAAVLHQRCVLTSSDVIDSPELTFHQDPPCCVRNPHCRHSLQAQNLMPVKLTQRRAKPPQTYCESSSPLRVELTFGNPQRLATNHSGSTVQSKSICPTRNGSLAVIVLKWLTSALCPIQIRTD